MIRTRDSIIIDRPAELVFSFLADLNNLPKWQSGVVQSKVISQGPVGVGTKFSEDVKMMGRKVTANCEVTAFEPGRKMGFSADGGGIRYQGAITLAPRDGKTELTLEGVSHLKGLWRLFQPFIAGEFKKELKKEMQTIKAAVEGAGAQGR